MGVFLTAAAFQAAARAAVPEREMMALEVREEELESDLGRFRQEAKAAGMLQEKYDMVTAELSGHQIAAKAAVDQLKTAAPEAEDAAREAALRSLTELEGALSKARRDAALEKFASAP
jgi:hypothetical protein